MTASAGPADAAQRTRADGKGKTRVRAWLWLPVLLMVGLGLVYVRPGPVGAPVAPTALPAATPTGALPPTPVATQSPVAVPTFTVRNVLLSENFDDPLRGRLSKVSAFPQWFEYEYVGGEYAMRKVEAERGRNATYTFPVPYANISIRIDARIVGPTEGRYVRLACRKQPDDAVVSEYLFLVQPTTGFFRLGRFDRNEERTLVPGGEGHHPAIRRGNERNTLELTCVGDLIVASVNDTVVAAARDRSYSSGRVSFGVGSFRENRVLAEARFDNLAVLERDGAPAS